MDIFVKVNSLSGGYRNRAVIKDISFSVTRGSFLGIIGPNGSGKTTLLRLLTRAIPIDSGGVRLEGKSIAGMDSKEFCRQVALVPQETIVNFPFSVFEVVLLGRIPHLKRLQPETKKDRQIASDALAMTDVGHLEDKRIDELSSGERQRVIIAKALTQEPALLFLDEPTSHLDIGHQIQVLDLLRRLNREKHLTIVMVLHDLNLAAEFCNRIILLDKGEIFKEGSPEEVLTYQNIEAVYKTRVVVRENPYSHKPFVVLVPKGDK